MLANAPVDRDAAPPDQNEARLFRSSTLPDFNEPADAAVAVEPVVRLPHAWRCRS